MVSEKMKMKINFKLLWTMVVAIFSFAIVGGTAVMATLDGGNVPTPIVPTTYNINVNIVGSGSVTVNGTAFSANGVFTRPVGAGDTLTVTTAPAAGYVLAATDSIVAKYTDYIGVPGVADPVGTNGVYTVDGGSNVTITVTFVSGAYPFTIGPATPTTGGALAIDQTFTTPPIASPVAYGTMIKVVATPAANHRFSGVSITPKVAGAGTPISGSVSGNTATFLSPAYEFVITPLFITWPTAKIEFKADAGPNGATTVTPALVPPPTGGTAINLTEVPQGTSFEFYVDEPTSGGVFDYINARVGTKSINSYLSHVSTDPITKKRIYNFTVPTDIDDKAVITITAHYFKTFAITLEHLPANLGGVIEPGYGIITKTTAGSGGNTYTYSCRYNDEASFYAIPDANYKIKDVVINPKAYVDHGNGYYTIGPVNSDITVKATFVSLSDGVVDSVVDGSGPSITVKSIADIYDQLYDFNGNKRNEGVTIIAPVDTTAMIDKSFFDMIRGRNVNIMIKGDVYSWTFNGKRVAPKEQILNSSNLDVQIEKYELPVATTAVTTRKPSGTGTTATTEEPIDPHLIPEKYMKQLHKYPNMYKVDVAYDGVLPFTGKLSLNVGTENAGLFGNLYYFNEKTHKFDGRGSAPVKPNGDVSFEFNHASRYVIVLSNRVLTELDLVKGAGITQNETIIPGMDGSQLGIAAVIFAMVIIGGIVLLTVMKKSRTAD